MYLKLRAERLKS